MLHRGRYFWVLVVVALATSSCATGERSPESSGADLEPCKKKLAGDWSAMPTADVRFDFERGVYQELGYGGKRDKKLVVKSCEADRAVVLLDGCEHLVELEKEDVARVWYGDTPQSTVGLVRLRDGDGTSELAAPYVRKPLEAAANSDGGPDADELDSLIL